MKQKCSFILRASLALVLTVLMVLGSVSTVIAAVADVAAGDDALPLAAKKGFDIAATGADADVASTGLTGGGYIYVSTQYAQWSNGNSAANWGDGVTFVAVFRDSNDTYETESTHQAGTWVKNINGSNASGGQIYRFSVPSGTWSYMRLYRASAVGWNNKYNETGKIALVSDSSSNNMLTYFKEGSDGSTSNWEDKYQYDSSASLSASKTSVSTGENVTLTPGISTNTNFNAYKSVSYSISPSSGASITGNTFKATSAGTYTVTATVTYNAKGFTNITKTATKTATITVTQAATTYTSISAAAKGSTDGSTFNTTLSGTPATISANSYTTGSSALNISAGTVSGYTFYKWVVTAGSGTIGSDTTANTTFTPSASNTTVTARYKKSYTLSKNSPTGGSVALSKTSAVAGDSYTVTLTPNDGYKVKSLTLNNSAVTVSNNKYTGTASGTSDTLAFVATFEPNTSMNLYIAGRFRVRPSEGSSSWTTTYASGSDWNATSTNIPFTYLSGTTYKVDTYATLAELSAKIGSSSYTGDPVFFVYDTTNSKNWYASSATTMSTSGTTLVSSGGANSNLKFSSSSTDGPVTIYYDSNTHKIWYSIPDLYNVTIGSVTGGSVTASPARCEEDATVTLTISPDTGYQLKSISAKDSSNATVTLSGTGTTRTFTMPAKNVTVTPVFEKISYSVSVAAKYSNNGTDFNQDFASGSAPTVTIGANTATQIDGTTVSASDIDGYVFVGWATNTGSTTQFGNQLDKATTFKPTSGNTQAIARYKKVFTITSSVDNTGTGAGTVTTSKTSVEAGGSYTIIATAKSGSAVESVKVNGTAKTATASQTISGVSANQTVVVKFKSNVYLRGGSTIGTNWTTGDAMTSNAAGTEFTKTYENVAGSSSGTQYQFKLFVGDYNNDGTATINITGGTSTGTCTHQSSGDQNYVLTLKKAANVTVKSNGTKITEIKVVPANSTKFAVTFKKAANTTITGQYEGTNFTTASADAVVQVYEGDEISFTVTAASGYHISALSSGTTPAFSPAVTKTYKLSNVTATKTITPTAAADVNVTAKTNKSSRGTVSVDKTKSYKGDTIKITVTPLAGSLKSLTAVYASGATYEYKNNAWSVVAGTNGSALTSKLFSKIVDIAATGAELDEAAVAAMADIVPVGAAQTINMTMQEDSTVTINATFDTYSGESNYYYNGYDTSGNAVSGYHDKQMTEGMIGGEKFSYYHVQNRSGADQLFTVSLGHGGTSNGKVYFTRPGSSNDWNQSNVYAYFWTDGGSAPTAWPGSSMSWRWNNEYGQGVYSVDIPTGVDRVSFNDNSGHQTVDINLTTTNGAYYWDGSKDSSNHYNVGTWSTGQDDQGLKNVGNEYFYSNTIYLDNFYSGGFNNHNVTNVNNFIKPKGGNGVNWDANSQKDYYIVVLYPNTTYTIDYNGHNTTNTVGNEPMVIWMTDLPTDDENVTVYAKDGAIRAETFGATYANIADTKIYLNNTVVGTDHSGNITNQTYQTYKAAKGDTLVIKTQIGATDSSNTGVTGYSTLRNKYYVRGFCVNGEVSELLEWNANGLYTLTYKIPEDTEITKFEITPIYYLKDTTNNPIVTYRVTGFTDELKAVGTGKPGWGDTLYTYPYYGKLGGDSNAFGAYPGQPMVYYKGQYQMQIPQKSTTWVNNTSSSTTVSGVTMSNGYWDSVHKSIMGYGDNSTSADHVQTYDYGDFYKIFNEKKPVDNIVFDFKYRTKKHNLVNDNTSTSIAASTLTSAYGTNGNGFEMLTNFHGKNVDLFGNPLSGDAANPSKTTPIYVVSIGGVNDNVSGVENIAGYYATEWRVYAPNTPTSLTSTYKKVTVGNKSSIPPEVLVLNNDDNASFNTSTYPSADASHNVTDWKAMYTELKKYAGHPVMISYEAADAQQGQGMYYTGTGGATRNDGRWLYSKNGENITSNIKIQYSNDNGVTYTDLDTTSPQVTGLSAYFTNDGVEGEMTYATTIDPDKTFDLEAKTTNANYKFVGWFMEDGTKITTDNASHTERSGSYTFVAKFMEVQSGQLILSHSTDTNSTYKGAGTAKISAVVKDGDEVIRTYDLSASDITMDDKIIKSDSTYTIEVTLEATATGFDSYGNTTLAAPSGQDATYFSTKSSSTQGKTKTIVLNSFTVASLFSGTTQNVKNIIYHSYFNQAVFNYTLTFNYKDRFNNDKSFTRQGKLTSAQAANENYVENASGTLSLLPAFIQTVAPFESNIGENITWNITKQTFNASGSNYNCTGIISAEQTKATKKNVTFKLPYQHTNGIVSTGKTGIAAQTTDFALTGNNAVTIDTIPVLLNNDVNGVYDEAEKKNWIVAPSTIDDNGTPKYFQYWSVKSTSADKDTDPDVARCYFEGFNFCVFDNYVVTPVYGTEKTSVSDSGIYSGASYLETSRNQWNDNKDRGKTETVYASDLLYNDFILNYNYKGVDIYKGGTDTADIIELGVVVERVKELDINQDGSKNTDISNYTSVAENLPAIKAAINGDTSNKSLYKDAIQKTDLDNKNRAKFCEAFYNGRGWSMENQTSAAKYAYRNYVYRAYTYIKYNDDQNNAQIQLCDKPVYFTMYNEAVADYTAPTTSGN